ncbi:hypothetical protein HPB50_014826 [Hyalomma asiaticum]|uniref:Uncharacterized protein n=1 Tax=Hyalomma asiaticum TaxID=266040 RepID=A0ACB7SHK6_HYAAI|nr:hypothetical protein HPB50_014826 [Hyalomma asiaticum]
MPLYGRLEPLERDGYSWPASEEQVHIFWSNNMSDEKQQGIFLATCEIHVYSTLINLLKLVTTHCKSPVPVPLSTVLCMWKRWMTCMGTPREEDEHWTIAAAWLKPRSHTSPRSRQPSRKGMRQRCAAAASGPSVDRLHIVAENPLTFDMWYTDIVLSLVLQFILTIEARGTPFL